ncbi:MAG: YajQ family cyclic di-GMP-binding protein [Dehalococcoidia bacterium]
MASQESFDITTGCDLQEVDNAVNQARRELTNRFDFKNVLVEIDYDRTKATLGIHTTDEYKLDAVWEVLQARLVARNVPLKNLQRGQIDKAGQSTVRQQVTMVQAIDADLGRKIVKFIKDQKFKKAQTQIQGDAVRVSGPSRDELQAVITAVKKEDWGVELKFGNFRA